MQYILYKCKIKQTKTFEQIKKFKITLLNAQEKSIQSAVDIIIHLIRSSNKITSIHKHM
jgi:hypothetical protein